MENTNIKDTAASQLIDSLISSESTDNEIVIKGVNCEILGLPSSSQVEFILCDVRITGSEDDTDTSTDVINQLQQELNSKTEELNRLLNQTQLDQESFNNLLEQAAADKSAIETSQRMLNSKNKRISEIEESLRQQKENKLILETKISERVTLFNNLPSSVRDMLIDSYSREVKNLKEKRTAISTEIENLNNLLAREKEVRDTFETDVSEKTRVLFEKLIQNDK